MSKKRKFILSILCIAYFHSITAGFLAGTLVKSELGCISIEQISTSNNVSCYNFLNKTIATSPTSQISKKHASRYIRLIVCDTPIDVSFDHLFYLPLEHKWVSAYKLAPGNLLLTSTNEYVVIDDVQEINEEVDIYDITMAQCHNFYITEHEILVHNFPAVVIGAVWLCGGGVEFAGLYGGITLACGLIIGGIAAACKRRKHQPKGPRPNIVDSNEYNVEPIIGYQPSYSDELINLTPTMLPQQLEIPHGHLVMPSAASGKYDCFNRPPTSESALTSKSESAVTSDEIVALMGKNHNEKKPKQKRPQQIASAGGNPEDDDPRNQRWRQQQNEFSQHPYGKYVDDATYHHQNSKGGTGKGAKSPAPKNGQAALDNSIPLKGTSARRIGISEGEIVILDRTSENPELIFHGHVRKLPELDRDLKRFLKVQIKKGKIKGPLPKN